MAVALITRSEPFINTLDALSQSAKKVQALELPIDEAHEIVDVVDRVLIDLHEVPSLLSGIGEMLTGLEGVLDILDAVPLVDVVTGPCTQVVDTSRQIVTETNDTCQSIDHSVIKPCKTAFDDLNKGLSKAHDIVNTISMTIPDYLNTIEILHYLSEIAVPLTKILKGSEPAERLNKLLTALNKVEDDVGKALAPLAEFLNKITKVIGSIGEALSHAFKKMKSTMKMIDQGLEWVEHAFQPIIDGFHKVVHAIKPIRWALDAVHWIFEKVCKPIIHEILKYTGLENLINELTEKVEEKIGIKPIIDLLQDNINDGSPKQWKSQGGEDTANEGLKAWSEVTSIMKQYNTRDNKNFSLDINLLISAISGTAIDPNSPATLPDWPNQPNVNVASDTYPLDTHRKGAVAQLQSLTQSAPLSKAMYGTQLLQGFQSLASISKRSTQAYQIDTQDVSITKHISALVYAATPIDCITPLHELHLRASKAHDDLAVLRQIGSRLVQDLNTYDTACTVPANFHLASIDLKNLMEDCAKSFDFIEQFGFLNRLIEDLKAPLTHQAQGMLDIVKACDELIQAGKVMDSLLKQTTDLVPSSRTLAVSLDYFDEIALGAATLSSAIAQAYTLDNQLNKKYEFRLKSLEQELDHSVQCVVEQIENVENLAHQSLNSSQIIHEILIDYASALSALSHDAEFIASIAQPKIAKSMHILHTLVSILDPLSGLLQHLDCVDKHDPVKQGAASSIETFKNTANTLISKQDKVLRELLESALSYELHTDRITRDIAVIQKQVQEKQATFNQAQVGLQAALHDLPAAMKHTQAFSSTNKAGETITIANSFIDQALATKAQDLLTQIQKDAEEAGYISFED